MLSGIARQERKDSVSVFCVCVCVSVKINMAETVVWIYSSIYICV